MSEKIVAAVSINRTETSWVVMRTDRQDGLPDLKEEDIVHKAAMSNVGKNLRGIIEHVSDTLRPYACSVLAVGSFGPFFTVNSSRGEDIFISEQQTELQAGNQNLSELFEQYTDIRPAIITDATAVALGEFLTRYKRRDPPFDSVGEHASGYKRKTLVSLIFGKGVGGGFTIGGKVSPFTYHSEMGHMPVVKMENERRGCACRFHNDCLTGYLGRDTLDKKGDKLSDLGLHQFSHYAAQLCAAVTYILGPDAIALTGSTIQAYPDETIPMIRDELENLLQGRRVAVQPFIAQERAGSAKRYISQADKSSYLMGTLLHAIDLAHEASADTTRK